ncbi:hypothetical protein M9H77_17183 [Catharanthus roseus]|uniref:Uncharacterized protein n=1 Tax=Catharanthus roseus TaxID=4058 RepID=A0ACC0B3V6_CATRO|nr:hypothetical protein M9H77_17183 [Catharanthus roseus]
MSKYLSTHTSLEDPLMSSGVKFDPSCYGFGMLGDTSLVGPDIVGFELDYASFDILHDECLGKFIEDVDYAFPFLDSFMKNLDGVISFNQCFYLFNGQFEFSYNEHKLSSVANSLNMLFENIFGFKIYRIHFKDFLLKGFGIMVEIEFEQVCKGFVVEHFYYHIPFKELFSKLVMSLDSFQNNSWAL